MLLGESSGNINAESKSSNENRGCRKKNLCETKVRQSRTVGSRGAQAHDGSRRL